jgi:hypothetical protein
LPADAWRPAYVRAYRARRIETIRATMARSNYFYPELDVAPLDLAERSEYSAAEQRFRESRLRAELFSAEAAELEARIASVRQPPWLRFGIGSLQYFALAGIVAPIAVMPLRPEAFSPGLKGLFMALFISGFGAVFGYIIGSAVHLTSSRPRDRAS